MFELTKNESWVVWRRRKNMTQAQAAQQVGIPHRRYGKWERGSLPCERQALSHLTVAEKSFICRKRANKTQQQVAEDIGLSRVTINRMEHGLVPVGESLKAYWGL